MAKQSPSKSTPPTASVADIEKAILQTPHRLSEGVDHCLKQRGGQHWPEWEKVVLEHLCERPSLGNACLRYVREVIGGRWHELENAMLSSLASRKHLLEYIMSGVVASPCKSLEKRLLNTVNSPALVYVYTRWVLGRPWNTGEQKILQELTCGINSLLWWDLTDELATEVCATEYTIHVRNGSWPALKQKVIGGDCTPRVAVDYVEKITRQPIPTVERNILSWRPRDPDDMEVQVDAVTRYVRVFPDRVLSFLNLILAGTCSPLVALQFLPALGQTNRWKPFESLMLGMNPSKDVYAAIITYTTTYFPRRWKKAEAYFLAQPKDDAFRDAVIRYAQTAIKGRWPRVERYLEGSPTHLLKYADEVLEARLPEQLHAAMTMMSFATPDDPHIKLYFEWFGI